MLKVSALAAQFSSATASVIIQTDQVVTNNFALNPNPGSVAGCVNDYTNGADIIGAHIEIFDANNTKVTTVLTNSLGLYRVTGLVPGSYTARATASGYGAQLIGFNIQSTATACFTLSPNPASLRGTITDATNGRPLEGAIIDIRIANTFGVPLLTTKSGVDGTYAVSGLVPDNYTITARLPGYASSVDAIVLSPGQAAIVNFAMRPNPATVTGTVTDAATGKPLANALVTLSDSRSIAIAQIQTDAAGRFLLEGVRCGEYSITVVLVGKQSISTCFFLAPGQRLNLSLSMRDIPAGQGGNVSTVPIQGPPNPVPGAVVQILNKNNTLVATSVANYDGAFQFPSLAPGCYTVTVENPGFGSQSAFVRLKAGKTAKPLSFLLNAAPGALAGTVRDIRGNPLFFVIVQVLTKTKILERLVITNRLGRYGVADLSPGTYLVRFLLEGKQPLVREIAIFSGRTTILDVILLDEHEE
ncbi:MSCRAMM family protein [Ferviditalea candida]|uniref:Carboxypeptidase regulatory-like domain-containing protein n=1 Tax=Ferviditalea candida TaxID=3108399 RepID=A0ABU5ZMU7_9BACL|nr:carboxypeptidase regulatory-like domain-containing protein [Paenibacillaceae bacterium T2]